MYAMLLPMIYYGAPHTETKSDNLLVTNLTHCAGTVSINKHSFIVIVKF